MLKLTLLILLFISSINANNTKNILILHSYHKSMSWVNNIDKAINDVIKPTQNNFTIYTEYMDTKRTFNKTYITQLKNIYKLKYQDIKFDLILSSDNNAFNFLKKNRNTLFGKVPTVFCGVNYFKDTDLDGFSNVTGVTETIDARKTIEVALKLLPKTKNIFVINDYLTTGKLWKKDIKEQLNSFNLNITYNKNVSMNELQKTIKQLPEDTIILLGIYFRDKNNKFFSYNKITTILSKISNIPIFTLADFYVRNGIIGGSVVNGYEQGRYMSLIANTIIKVQEDVRDISVLKQNTTKQIFDYLPSDKFNLNLNLLDSDVTILNKQESYYEKNKFIIINAITVIVVLLLIIILLLINIKKRNYFEKLLIKSKKQIVTLNKTLEEKIDQRTKELERQKEIFETMYNGTKDAIAILDLKSNFTKVNPAYLEMTGFTEEELLKTSCYNLTVEEDKEISKEAVNEVLKIGFIKNFEKRCIIKSNDIITTNMSMSFIKNPDRILISVRDITEQKRKDKLLFEQTRLASLGEMIGNIAHQWRQPLSIISTLSSGIQVRKEVGTLSDKLLDESCESINKNVQYLSKTIDDFKNFVKGDRKKSTFDIDVVINNFLLLMDASIKNSNINIVLDLEKNLKMNAYENELVQCFINIYNNSKDALIENNIKDKYIFISTKLINHNIVIQIKDNANGIPIDVLPKIFEPYFTTKHKSQGTGLGLNMTHKLITQGLKGKIQAHNSEFIYNGISYKGAEFTIISKL